MIKENCTNCDNDLVCGTPIECGFKIALLKGKKKLEDIYCSYYEPRENYGKINDKHI